MGIYAQTYVFFLYHSSSNNFSGKTRRTAHIINNILTNTKFLFKAKRELLSLIGLYIEQYILDGGSWLLRAGKLFS
jgi:hypothetical protein